VSLPFNRVPKFIMFYLFPVDSILRERNVTLDTIDRSNICLSRDPDVARRCLHLFHHVPPDEIISDLKEMNFTGLACVGVDGASIAIEDIRSKRYSELIRKCQQAGLLFIHSFPFADTYHNDLTRRFPHIKQKNFEGKHPYVGWDEVNAHFNIDYGSDEFIEFCKKSIDALQEYEVGVIDYAEPDHYPIPDNGYGESLVKAWTEKTGQPAPHPPTVQYRRFMEERNLRGVREIGTYAHAHGMADHLTASPLCHVSPLICHNYGKYSNTGITQLSTTYHAHFGYNVAEYMDRFLQMRILPAQADGIGCIESKSMRNWAERHAVYFGCGQGLPLERAEDFLHSTVLLHQMDLFFWDYGNFRNQSMYLYNRFEDPQKKFKSLKNLVRSTIETYFTLPDSYRNASPAPEALVFYAKEGDYLRYIDGDLSRPPAWASLYAIAFRLQSADISFMFAYDEYPDILKTDGREVALLIIDGDQCLSQEFAAAVRLWFGPGKVLFCGGDLGPEQRSLLQELGERSGGTSPIELESVNALRDAHYVYATSAFPLSDWQTLLTWNKNGILYLKGTPDSGYLLYSEVPIARLAPEDLRKVLHAVLNHLDPHRAQISGLLTRELVKYRGPRNTFLALKNHSAETGVLRVETEAEPIEFHPRQDEIHITKEVSGHTIEMNFRPREVRLIECA
jgi:hypothetical protein